MPYTGAQLQRAAIEATDREIVHGSGFENAVCPIRD